VADPVLQPPDVIHQGPILAVLHVEILVPGEEVAERFRGQQHLKRVQRPPLVDIHQPPLEDRAAIGEIVLGQRQLLARAAELVAQAAHLPLQLVDEAVGRFALPLDVAELRAGISDLALQPLLFAAELVPLGPDVLQASAGSLGVGLLGGGR
jgi:hypothetical protein